MAYLIGADEAGYGPNLGPLVISASVWQVPDGALDEDLYRRLKNVISRQPERSAGNPSGRVVIGDSKVLYQPSRGLAQLEHGLLAALALLGRCPRTWRQAWDALAPDASGARESIPWYTGYEASVPIAASPAENRLAACALETGLGASGVRLVELRSRVVFEEEFNGRVGQYGSKGETLSQITLALVCDVCRPLPAGPIRVVCDKHGGRSHYQHLLAQHFPQWLIEVYGEGRQQSVYRFGPRERRMEIRFHAKAEAFLPTALASMASKYLRELAMEALNAYWCAQVSGLNRTAGYPADSRRFKNDIAAAQARLGIEDRVLWRSR